MLLKYIDQIGLTHDRSACRVDEYRCRLHEIEMLPPDHPFSLWRLTYVHADNVGTPEDLFKRDPLRDIADGMECPGNDFHADSLPESGNLSPYRSSADKPQCLSTKLSNKRARPLPFANLPIDGHR